MKEKFWKEVRVCASSSGCVRLCMPADEVWLEPKQVEDLIQRLKAALCSPLLQPVAIDYSK